MRKVFSIVMTVLALNTFAQTGAKATVKTTKTAATPKLSATDIAMCDKNWAIVSVEEWGVVAKPPAEKNKTDMLKLSQDGKYNLIMAGVAKSGTWTKSGQYIYFTDEATKIKFNYKVVSSDATTLKVDHYSDEDGHSMFEYEAK